MAKRKLTSQEEMQKTASREMTVAKSNQMIQKGRVSLSLKEQKCVLYAISKIKPEDDIFKEYVFDISEFYNLCGIEDRSYTRLKATLTELKRKVWWIETAPGEESTVSWFNKVRTNQKSGKVTIRFDDDMMPYLLQLAELQKEEGSYYTQYGLKYILPMQSQYSPKLYELLKSYQINNYEWFFEVEDLKRLLDCQNYHRWPDFKRRALEPAVEEINKYSDINIAYDVETKGRKVVRVIFYMAKKKKEALLEAERAGMEQLEGQIDMDELFEEVKNRKESVKAKFIRENL